MWLLQHDWSCLRVPVLACFLQNSVFGRCEVMYEVTRVPRSVALVRPEWFPSAERCGHLNFFELFKTRNFTNCEYSAEFHFGLPVSKKCQPGGIACDDFWAVSTRQCFLDLRFVGFCCRNNECFSVSTKQVNSAVIIQNSIRGLFILIMRMFVAAFLSISHLHNPFVCSSLPQHLAPPQSSRLQMQFLTLRLLMSYIYGAPILDVSRSHTTTQHSR